MLRNIASLSTDSSSESDWDEKEENLSHVDLLVMEFAQSFRSLQQAVPQQEQPVREALGIHPWKPHVKQEIECVLNECLFEEENNKEIIVWILSKML